MTIIKNIRTVTAETLFGTLNVDFATFVNQKLGSDVRVEFAHVDDIINVSFPEIVPGIAFYMTVARETIHVTANSDNQLENGIVLEKQLIDFLELKLN